DVGARVDREERVRDGDDRRGGDRHEIGGYAADHHGRRRILEVLAVDLDARPAEVWTLSGAGRRDDRAGVVLEAIRAARGLPRVRVDDRDRDDGVRETGVAVQRDRR